MNKEATIVDSVFYIVIVFVLAVAIVIGYRVADDINTHIQGVSDEQLPTASKEVVSGFNDRYAAVFDYGFLIVFIFLLIATIVTGMMFDTHPALYFVSAFLLFILIILGAIFANTFEEFTATDQLATMDIENNLPIIYFFMTHFVAILVVFLFLVMGITYARARMA